MPPLRNQLLGALAKAAHNRAQEGPDYAQAVRGTSPGVPYDELIGAARQEKAKKRTILPIMNDLRAKLLEGLPSPGTSMVQNLGPEKLLDAVLSAATGEPVSTREQLLKQLINPIFSLPERGLNKLVGDEEMRALMQDSRDSYYKAKDKPGEYPKARKEGVAKSVGQSIAKGVDNVEGGKYNYTPVEQYQDERGTQGIARSLLERPDGSPDWPAPLSGWNTSDVTNNFQPPEGPQGNQALHEMASMMLGQILGRAGDLGIAYNDVASKVPSLGDATLPAGANQAANTILRHLDKVPTLFGILPQVLPQIATGAPEALRNASPEDDFAQAEGARGKQIADATWRSPDAMARMQAAGGDTPESKPLLSYAGPVFDPQAYPDTAEYAKQAGYPEASQVVAGLLNPANLVDVLGLAGKGVALGKTGVSHLADLERAAVAKAGRWTTGDFEIPGQATVPPELRLQSYVDPAILAANQRGYLARQAAETQAVPGAVEPPRVDFSKPYSKLLGDNVDSPWSKSGVTPEPFRPTPQDLQGVGLPQSKVELPPRESTAEFLQRSTSDKPVAPTTPDTGSLQGPLPKNIPGFPGAQIFDNPTQISKADQVLARAMGKPPEELLAQAKDQAEAKPVAKPQAKPKVEQVSAPKAEPSPASVQPPVLTKAERVLALAMEKESAGAAPEIAKAQATIDVATPSAAEEALAARPQASLEATKQLEGQSALPQPAVETPVAKPAALSEDITGPPTALRKEVTPWVAKHPEATLEEFHQQFPGNEGNAKAEEVFATAKKMANVTPADLSKAAKREADYQEFLARRNAKDQAVYDSLSPEQRAEVDRVKAMSESERKIHFLRQDMQKWADKGLSIEDIKYRAKRETMARHREGFDLQGEAEAAVKAAQEKRSQQLKDPTSVLPQSESVAKLSGRLKAEVEARNGNGGVKLHASLFGLDMLPRALSYVWNKLPSPRMAADAYFTKKVQQFHDWFDNSTSRPVRSARRLFSEFQGLDAEMGRARQVSERNVQAGFSIAKEALQGLLGHPEGSLKRKYGGKVEVVTPEQRAAAVRMHQGIADAVDLANLQSVSPRYLDMVKDILTNHNNLTNKLMSEQLRVNFDAWNAMDMKQRYFVHSAINNLLNDGLEYLGPKTAGKDAALAADKAFNSVGQFRGEKLIDAARREGVDLASFRPVIEDSVEQLRGMLLHGDKGIIDQFLTADQYFKHHGTHRVNMMRYYEAGITPGDLPGLIDHMEKLHGPISPELRNFILDNGTGTKGNWTARQKHRVFQDEAQKARDLAKAQGNPKLLQEILGQQQWSDHWKELVHEITDPSYGIAKSIAHTRQALETMKMRRLIATDELMASKVGESKEAFAQRINVPIDDVINLRDEMRPEHYKYAGPLLNRYVVRDAADYLANHVAPSLSQGQSVFLNTLRAMNNSFKANKTLFNPSSHVRQLIQNTVQTSIDIGFAATAKHLGEALKDFREGSAIRDLAMQHGLLHDNALADISEALAKNELRGFEASRQGLMGGLERLVSDFSQFKARAGEAYQAGDQIFKMVHFRHWLDKGLAPDLAARAAENSVYTGAHQSRMATLIRGGDFAKTYFQRGIESPKHSLQHGANYALDVAGKAGFGMPFAGAQIWGARKMAQNLFGVANGSVMPFTDCGKAVRAALWYSAPIAMTLQAIKGNPDLTPDALAETQPLHYTGPGVAVVPDRVPNWVPFLGNAPLGAFLHADGKVVFTDFTPHLPGLELFRGEYDKTTGGYTGGNPLGINYLRKIANGNGFTPDFNLPMAPLLQAIYEGGANKRNFTQREITPEGSPEGQRAIDAANNAWQIWAPPLLPNYPSLLYNGMDGRYSELGFARAIGHRINDLGRASGPEASGVIAATGARLQDIDALMGQGMSLPDAAKAQLMAGHQASTYFRDYNERERFMSEVFLRVFLGQRTEGVDYGQGQASQMGAYLNRKSQVERTMRDAAKRYEHNPDKVDFILDQAVKALDKAEPQPLPHHPAFQVREAIDKFFGQRIKQGPLLTPPSGPDA